MGYKNVCIACRRVESLGKHLTTFRTGECPRCSTPMHFVCQKFRPPKVTDERAWAVAEYLITHGYTYYTIRDSSGMPITYPTTMDAAQRFVKEHRADLARQRVRHKHSLEKQLEELRRRPSNRSRDKLIADIAAELAKYD